MLELEIENVLASADMGRTIDIESLLRNDAALRDGGRWVKYMIPIPGILGRSATIHVYKTGKIICTGANTVRRAIDCTKRILSNLENPYAPVQIEHVMMSGHITDSLDIYRAIPRLEDRYNIRIDAEVMRSVIFVDSNTYTQVHDSRPIALTSRGPDEKTITSSVQKIYDSMQVGLDA